MYVHVSVVALPIRFHETLTDEQMLCACYVYLTVSVSNFQSEMMILCTLQAPLQHMEPHLIVAKILFLSNCSFDTYFV